MSYLPSIPDGTLLDVFKTWPTLARHIHEFAETLMRGPSPFSEGERELIAAYVSSLNGCEYCQASHTEVAGRFGIDTGLVDAAVEDIETSGVPDKLKPVLRYCRVLNDRPDRVEKSHVDAMFKAGWDETAVCHAAVVCGYFNLMNRWVDGLGIPVDPQMVKMAGRMLHEKGYKGISDVLDKSGEDTGA